MRRVLLRVLKRARVRVCVCCCLAVACTEGSYACPVTGKVFTEHTHIAAVKTTGNVYAYEAVREDCGAGEGPVHACWAVRQDLGG